MSDYGPTRPLDVRPGDRVRPTHNRRVCYRVEEIDGERLHVSRTYTRKGEVLRTDKTVANDARRWEAVRDD